MDDPIPAPCGAVCQDCSYYQHECKGCYASHGEVWWITYTDLDVCEQYECCRITSGFRHCGECNEFPCALYDETDPELSFDENLERKKKRIAKIREWIAEDEASGDAD